ncbi:MAG TPA: tetratricopeptide repeat-containing sensor histidine kinase [Chitinophagaceae bacterium]|nr:tetratricopeptide repeat-containing sensor histidine kinase [Chitinophagaceae bacterium]
MHKTILKKSSCLLINIGQRVISLLFISTCVFLSSNAQTKEELLQKYHAAQEQQDYKPQKAIVDLLNNLSAKYLFDNPDSAMFFASSALQAAIAQQYLIGQERAMSGIGKAYYVKGSYDSALSFSDRAMHLSEQLHDSTGIAGALNNIGLIYLAHEEIPAAIAQFNKALAMAEQVNNRQQVAADLFDIGICYDEVRKLDSAEWYLNKAMEADTANEEHHITAMAYNRMGKTLYYKGKYGEAIAWYKKVLDYTAYRDNWELAFAYGGLAETYYDLKDYATGINYGLQSFAFAQEMNAKWDAEQALKILSKSYAAAGDFKNAYRYQVLDGMYNDSLYNEAQDQVVSHLKLQQKEAANEALKKQNELVEQKIHLTWVYNICISIFALALIILTILLYRNNKAKEALNRQLLEKNNNIERLNVMKDQLFAVVSHDLRGPIGSLQQTLQYIMEDVLPENERKYLLESLYRQVTVSNQMLNNLLTWAATQRSGITAQLEKIKPGDVIKEVLAVFETLAVKKNISLLYDDTNERPLVADQNQLRIIVQNLLSNAIKFTPTNGKVSIFFTHDAGTVTIHIRDTGTGMSAKKVEKLFNSFGSVVSTFGTAKEKGAGIGLMIVKEFTDQNKGQLAITSEEGSGTTFSVSFLSA